MLRTRQLNKFMNMMVGPEIQGAYLYTEEGNCHAKVGPNADNVTAAVCSSLSSTIFEAFERTVSREKLQEFQLECDDTVIIATQILNFILVIQGQPNAPMGLLRSKLHTFAKKLKEPLSYVILKDQ
uniref:Ragulator complex protein LAMTOR2 n=1 Tax=Parastrongyloides trichosuri TaxID=131310 RepID=A0A0N4ZJ90_PARTI